MCAGTAGCLCQPHQHRDAPLSCVRLAPQVFSLQQGKRDIDAIYSMGLFEDVAMRPQPAEGSSLENPKVRQPNSHIYVCPASCWTSFVVGNQCQQSVLAIGVGNTNLMHTAGCHGCVVSPCPFGWTRSWRPSSANGCKLYAKSERGPCRLLLPSRWTSPWRSLSARRAACLRAAASRPRAPWRAPCLGW